MAFLCSYAQMSRAVPFLIIATFLYASINIGVKFLSHLPATEIVTFRQLITLLVSGVILLQQGRGVRGNNTKLLFARGFFGSIALVCLFICVQNTPLAIATTLINLTPIFTVVIAHFYLKEKASPIQWGFLLLAFAGVVLIRGGVEPVPWIWIGVGLAAALFAAITYTVVRELRRSDEAMTVIFFFPLVTLPLVGPVALYQWVPPQSWDWLLLLAIGLLTVLAQYFMTVAYQLEKASNIMVFNYTGLLWGIVFGWVIFNEELSGIQFVGVFIIFLCLIGNFLVTRSQSARFAFFGKIR